MEIPTNPIDLELLKTTVTAGTNTTAQKNVSTFLDQSIDRILVGYHLSFFLGIFVFD